MSVSHGCPAISPSGTLLSSIPSFATAVDGTRTAATPATTVMTLMPAIQPPRRVGSRRSAHRACDPQRVCLRDMRLEPQQHLAAPPEQRVGREPRGVALHLAVAVAIHE